MRYPGEAKFSREMRTCIGTQEQMECTHQYKSQGPLHLILPRSSGNKKVAMLYTLSARRTLPRWKDKGHVEYNSAPVTSSHSRSQKFLPFRGQ